MSMYELSDEQVHAIRLALSVEIDQRTRYRISKNTIDPYLEHMESASNDLADQWHAQQIAMRDAALREGK